MRKNLLPIIFMPLVLLTACGDDNADYKHEVESLIIKNKQLWQDANLRDYTFTYSSAPGDCPLVAPLPPRTIVVEDGKVISSTTQSFKLTNLKNQPTIDTIFEDMLTRLNDFPKTYSAKWNNKDSLTEFHPTLGYPTAYFIDQSSKECDSKEVSIYNFS